MNAIDISYVRYQMTDLERATSFLLDFGLSVARRDTNRVYFRGAGPAPFLYEANLGGYNRFLGAGFKVDSLETLRRLATLPGSGAVEPVEGPGAGQRTRMQMVDGFLIDAVWGAADAPPLSVRAPNPFNAGQEKTRQNAVVRQRPEAAPVLRLGHVVLHVRDHDASVAWLQERLGLLASDFFAALDKPEKPIGTFLRVNRGKELVDHHCLLVLQADAPGVHHCAFEIQDLDHVMAAHDFLSAKNYRLDCGVGRHLLGSQIFDYWRDPFGFRIEHYTDGDVVNGDHKASTFSGTADETTQWGARPQKEFFELAAEADS
jgi:catechol 2,3-dioxygenase-like lactoylglutathione lyase family enzyme